MSADDAKTTLRAYAVIGVAKPTSEPAETWVSVKKVVFTRESAVATVEKLTAADPESQYFWQLTRLERLE